MNENFIKQTAKDYDMSEFQVKIIYEMWHEKGLFYEKLEEFIKQRANTYT